MNCSVSSFPFGSKKSILALLASSTLLNTAPKPSTLAGVPPIVPGIENVVLVTVLPIGVKSRSGLKTLKMVP